LLAIVAILVLMPVAWMISTSLKHYEDVFSIPPRWIPNPLTLANYIYLLTKSQFTRYLWNSLIIASFSCLISLIASCLGGYGLSRFNFKGKRSFLIFLLMTQMFPAVIMLVPYFYIMKCYGLIDTYFALILAYVSINIPFQTWMMKGYFDSISFSIDEAALVDGASWIQAFLLVVVPLALPGIAATAIYGFIMSWNEYLFAVTLTKSESMRTVTVGIATFITAHRIEWSDMMAACVIAAIPVIILYMILQKYFIRGLVAGAVKE